MIFIGYLVYSRRQWVGVCINGVYSVRLETRQHQIGALLRRVVIATGACVPTGVMHLVADIRQHETMYHLYMQ